MSSSVKQQHMLRMYSGRATGLSKINLTPAQWVHCTVLADSSTSLMILSTASQLCCTPDTVLSSSQTWSQPLHQIDIILPAF
jgi:hypothetical protein